MSASRRRILRLVVRRRANRNPDAGAREDLPPLEVERSGEHGLETFGDANGVDDAPHIMEEDHELVAAEAGERMLEGARRLPGAHDEVAHAERLFEPPGHGLQQSVTDFVAQTVVDNLEAVQIEKQDSELTAGVGAMVRERSLEAIDQEHPVRQPREDVDHFAFGDVRLRACHADRVPQLVAHGHAARQHPAVGARGMSHAVLVLEMRRSSGEMIVEIAPKAPEVLRMHAAEPLVWTCADLLIRTADDGLPTRGVVDDAVEQVPVPEAVVGAHGGQRIALFTGAEAILGLLPRQLRSDASERHREVDRFGDVVVGAEIEGRDDVVALILGRDHENRQF